MRILAKGGAASVLPVFVGLIFVSASVGGCNASVGDPPSGSTPQDDPVIPESDSDQDPTSTQPPLDPPPSCTGASCSSPMLEGRDFQQQGKTWVPADFQEVNLQVQFDVSAKSTTGKASIQFVAAKDGHPYFLMGPKPTLARLNGDPVEITDLRDPDGASRWVALGTPVKAGGAYTLDLEYALPSDEISYRAGGIGFVTAMADIADGNFFEAYGPANIEADQYKMSLDLSLAGAKNEHRLFTNGQVVSSSGTDWRVEFPEYFNSSSIYFHLTDADLAVRETVYEGMEKQIPITIYSQSASSADQAFARIKGLFKELEGTYGPYHHSSFTAYISGSGGMEHAGATITSVSALGHELTHSWFGRGVLPADGRSGWIDESIASWRDYGYSRASGLGNRPVGSLAAFSIFELFTPYASYSEGRTLMSELDYLFAPSHGGLKSVLRRWFARWKGHAVSTEVFKTFLEADTGISMGSLFSRYVYGGKGIGGAVSGEEGLPVDLKTVQQGTEGGHPPALTKEEVRALR